MSIQYICLNVSKFVRQQIILRYKTNKLETRKLPVEVGVGKKLRYSNLAIKNTNSTVGTIEMYDGVLCLLRSLVRLVVGVFTADLSNMVVCFAKLLKLLGSNVTTF